MKTTVILNPISGRGNGKSLLPTLEQLLHASGLDFELVLSERPWHAVELAEAAGRQGVEAVVAAGGDGTVNEIVNGLMRSQLDGFGGSALGVLAIGSGNDFAASLGISSKLERVIQAIKSDQRRKVDLGLLKGCQIPDGRYFANCVGIGFDAAGTILANRITWARGLLAYLIAAVQNIFLYYKAPTLRIETDNESLEMPSLLVSIMNGQRIGGGFWTAPEASPEDGLFDLCIAEEVSRPRMFTLIPHFLKGTQASQPEIRMTRTGHVRITALQGVMPLQADGEILDEACRELSIEILPLGLEIIGVTEAI